MIIYHETGLIQKKKEKSEEKRRWTNCQSLEHWCYKIRRQSLLLINNEGAKLAKIAQKSSLINKIHQVDELCKTIDMKQVINMLGLYSAIIAANNSPALTTAQPHLYPNSKSFPLYNLPFIQSIMSFIILCLSGSNRRSCRRPWSNLMDLSVDEASS